MEKKKVKRRNNGISHNRRHGGSDVSLPVGLHEVGPEAGLETETPANDHTENMTVQEAECKIAHGILERLEGLTLDELIRTFQFIMDLEKARVPDLGDLDMEGENQ